MLHDPSEFYQSWSGLMGKAKERAPEIGKAFGPFFQGLMRDGGDGSLPVKAKELIALGIAVALRCEHCIFAHVEKCVKAGATSREVMDAAGVAVMMGGGPAYTYTPIVAAALEHFESTGQLPRPTPSPASAVSR